MDRFLEFTGNHTLLVTALLVSFFVVIFSELRRKATGLINIEAAEAVKLINNDAVVIDLRSTESYGRGHIVNARNLGADEVQAKVTGIARDKSKPVVAVCDNGISSNRTVTGMNGWIQAGLPVVTGKKTKSKSGKGRKRG